MNRVRVAGNRIREEAKMTGMTPAVLMRRGMWVDCPPYIRRPTTRLAYWTGIFRCPSCMTPPAAAPQPHDQGGPGGQGQHGQEPEAPTRIGNEHRAGRAPHALETHRDAEGLHEG